MSDGLSKAEVKELLQAQADQFKQIIQELRKPTEVEQRKIDAEQAALQVAQEERKANSAAVIAQIEEKRTIQRICSHEHRDGHSHCVYIHENGRGPGYILCQKNQCKIRSGAAPKGYNGNDIYDTALFNQLFQKLPSNDMFN